MDGVPLLAALQDGSALSDADIDALLMEARTHPEALKPSVEMLFHAWLLQPQGMVLAQPRELDVVRFATTENVFVVWNAYFTTILQRDVRDLANIEGLTALPRLLVLLAVRAASLVNYSEISRSSGLPLSTLKRYITLLETTFLLRMLPAWHANIGKRLVKTPKLLLSDTGLAAQLVGLTEVSLERDMTPLGTLLENFVAMELVKQLTWSERQPSLYHFRLHTGREVDLVLEDAAGRLVGVKVKAGASVSGNDLKGLQALAEARPEMFHRGIVLYTGEEVVSFAPTLHAVPLHALWFW